MSRHAGQRLALTTMLLGIGVLAGTGWAFRDGLLEAWYLWRLAKGNVDEQAAAARRLGEMKALRAIPGLINVLRAHAQVFPFPWTFDERGAKEDRTARLYWCAENALVNLGTDALPAVVELLAGSYPEEKRCLNDSAAHILISIRPRSIPAFLDLVKHPASEVRRVAARILAESGPEGGAAALSALIGALKDEHPDVRFAAAAYLSMDDWARASEPALYEALHAETLQDQAAAYFALAAVYYPWVRDAVPALFDAVEDPDNHVQSEARESLQTILFTWAQDTVPFLVKILQSNKATRDLAAYFLGQIYSSDWLGPEVEAAVFTAALSALIDALGDGSEVIREYSAGALASIGPAALSAAPALGLALDDACPEVRQAAAKALKAIQGADSEEYAEPDDLR